MPHFQKNAQFSNKCVIFKKRQNFPKNDPFSKKSLFSKNAPFSKKCPIFTGLDLKRARRTGLNA